MRSWMVAKLIKQGSRRNLIAETESQGIRRQVFVLLEGPILDGPCHREGSQNLRPAYCRVASQRFTEGAFQKGGWSFSKSRRDWFTRNHIGKLRFMPFSFNLEPSCSAASALQMFNLKRFRFLSLSWAFHCKEVSGRLRAWVRKAGTGSALGFPRQIPFGTSSGNCFNGNQQSVDQLSEEIQALSSVFEC